MTDAVPDGRDLIRTMGWISLPYSCVGIIRKTAVSGRNTVWSWLILIPWGSESKPWIDGVEVIPVSTKTDVQERDLVEQHLRELLDERYGEAVANRPVDDFLREVLGDES